MRRPAAAIALVLLAAGAVGAVVTSPTSAAEAPQPREGTEHAVPLHGKLLRPYDAPDDPYAPGHRGVDVGADPGTPVRASAAGVVRFAGSVAGNRSVTIDHGEGLWTSYSFLTRIAVRKGQPVERGQILGATGDGHADADLPPHVHLSARRDGVYFDPLALYVGDDHSDLLRLVE